MKARVKKEISSNIEGLGVFTLNVGDTLELEHIKVNDSPKDYLLVPPIILPDNVGDCNSVKEWLDEHLEFID